jgi:hypothetical protein
MAEALSFLLAPYDGWKITGCQARHGLSSGHRISFPSRLAEDTCASPGSPIGGG